MQSVDLREAYLHVPIHPDHRKYLRFEYDGRHYQYCAMPFGLSSAPRTFTKLVSVIAAQISRLPVCLLCYLDNILVLSSSTLQVTSDISAVLQVFTEHSFSINEQKSHLSPTTWLLHLGALINLETCQVFLSPDKMQSLTSLVEQVLMLDSVSPLVLSQLLGKMVSCIAIVPWARKYVDPLQWLLLPYQQTYRATSRTPIPIPSRVWLSLHWWMSHQIQTTDGQGRQATGLGRVPPLIPQAGAHFRTGKHACRLAEQGNNRPVGVAVASTHLCQNSVEIQPPSGGSLYNSPKCSSSKILLPVPECQSGRL